MSSMKDLLELGGGGGSPVGLPLLSPNLLLSQFQIQSLLQCVVCKKPCASPIYACDDKQSHLMCTFCHQSKGKGSCPLCKSKTFRTCRLAESQSRQFQMQGKCPMGGCDTTALATLLKTHVDNCEYRGISCSSFPKGGDGICPKESALTELPKHLVAVHTFPLFSVKEEALLLPVNLPIGFKTGDESSTSYWAQEVITSVCPAVVEFGGHYFTLHLAVGNYQFYWWLTVFGGQKEANSYKYETQLVSKGEQTARFGSFHLLPVLPFHRYNKFEKHCWKYALVHAGAATEYLDNGYLTVKIKISKTSSNERNGNGGHQNKCPPPLRRGIPSASSPDITDKGEKRVRKY